MRETVQRSRVRDSVLYYDEATLVLNYKEKDIQEKYFRMVLVT